LSPVRTDFDLLEIQAAAMFVSTEAGRIRRENDPDRSPGPRLYLGGCASGNIVRIRHDVSDKTARAIAALAAQEPSLRERHSTPRHLNAYIELLDAETPVRERALGLVYELPKDVVSGSQDVTLVRSDTPEGDRLLAALVERGMPQAIVAAGFVTVSEFWPPWCVGLRQGEIASIAFGARIGPAGADLGVNTVPAFRGCGIAQAVTAGWASHPALRGHALFYSTARTNLSSQRVAEKLGLRFIGASLRVT
jgi:hypothetical protein